jgi:glutathione S-transferase
MEKMMKLYSGDLSPYSARIRMQIYAKGITGIALEWPETFGSPQFREQFPIGRIPVLDIDGDMMPESDVIAEYLEDLYPTPSLLGATPRETAHIRTLARVCDIYIMNNMFLVTPQGRRSTRSEAVRDLLTGQALRGVTALEALIDDGGFACCGRLTLADCALVPALFLVETVLPTVDVADPIPDHPKVTAYWTAIRQNEHGSRVVAEMNRGLDERRTKMRAAASKASA